MTDQVIRYYAKEGQSLDDAASVASFFANGIGKSIVFYYDNVPVEVFPKEPVADVVKNYNLIAAEEEKLNKKYDYIDTPAQSKRTLTPVQIAYFNASKKIH